MAGLLPLRHWIDLVEGKNKGGGNAAPWGISRTSLFDETLRENLRVFPDLRDKLFKFQELKLSDPLNAKYGKHDRPCTGELVGFWHCHLRDDAILIYNLAKRCVNLVAIVTHAEIEGKRLKKTAKRLQQFREDAVPDHDYDPEWDYEVEETPEDASELFQRVEARIRSELLPALGFPGFRIFVADLDGDVGKYCNGTSSYPFVGVDYRALVDGCQRYGVDVEEQLAATIAHELGHAYQESMGAEEIEHFDEDEAEQFAYRWITRGEVDISILQ